MSAMNRSWLGVVASVGFWLSGGLHAADCLPPGDVFSDAGAIVGSGGIETITNAGQGNFTCADIVSAFTGQPMEPVSITLGGLGNPDTWTLVPEQTTSIGLPVTGVKYIFAVGGQGVAGDRY